MIDTLRTKADVLDALEALETTGLRFWLVIDSKRFAEPFGEAWSPADNVRHLVKSTTPVTLALKLPRLALLALCWHANRASTPYEDLVERYHDVLAEGGKAGRYAPSPVRPPANLLAWQADLVRECQCAVRALGRAVEPWNERDLDRCQLPHPLLGRLTVREMLFSTLNHYEHHRAGVARRREAAADVGRVAQSTAAFGTEG
jgi:hypothetical protein